MTWATIKYGWLILASLTNGLDKTVFYDGPLTNQLYPGSFVEVAIGGWERCEATQLAPGSWSVPPIRHVMTLSTGVPAVVSEVVTNAFIWQTDRSMMVSNDALLFLLPSFYADTNHPYTGAVGPVSMVVSNIFSDLSLGDLTNKFIRQPALGTNEATYGEWPWQIYPTNLQERFKFTWALTHTLTEPPRVYAERWYGIGMIDSNFNLPQAGGFDAAYLAASNDYKFITNGWLEGGVWIGSAALQTEPVGAWCRYTEWVETNAYVITNLVVTGGVFKTIVDTNIVVVSADNIAAVAAGGAIITNDGYIIHSFTNVGETNFIVPAGCTLSCDILVVAGGGGGGYGYGSGGGAGGLVYAINKAITGSNSLTVGRGGAGGTGPYTSDENSHGRIGTNSIFANIIALGGGGGVCSYGGGPVRDGMDGGSGSGAGRTGGVGGTGGTGIQGSSGGGTGYGNDGSDGEVVTGGGGGAGETSGTGAGGDGLELSISGAGVYYAGGGGGYQAPGGLGGGGAGGSYGVLPTAGSANTGGGGGGANWAANGASGGSGIIIVRYKVPFNASGTYSNSTPIYATNAWFCISNGCYIFYNPTGALANVTATGGTITSNAGSVIHTFSASGDFTITGCVTGEVLVVAGGGGGGGGVGAGGGAGGIVYGSGYVFSSGVYSITVGQGGVGGSNTDPDDRARGTNGANSVFRGMIAIGGGGGSVGAKPANPNGLDGGSGGGQGYTPGSPGSGLQGDCGGGTGYGNDGGGGYRGGGGGALTAGSGGTGGDGKVFSISGSAVCYAGGGAGETASGAGSDNAGGGGDGGLNTTGEAGEDGVVIISYVPAYPIPGWVIFTNSTLDINQPYLWKTNEPVGIYAAANFITGSTTAGYEYVYGPATNQPDGLYTPTNPPPYNGADQGWICTNGFQITLGIDGYYHLTLIDPTTNAAPWLSPDWVNTANGLGIAWGPYNAVADTAATGTPYAVRSYSWGSACWTDVVYKVELQRVGATNDLGTSTNIEHSITGFYALAEQPAAGAADAVEWNDQDLGLVEDEWNHVYTNTAWGYDPTNSVWLLGEMADRPRSNNWTQVDPIEYDMIGGFQLGTPKAVTEWEFEYCTNRWW